MTCPYFLQTFIASSSLCIDAGNVSVVECLVRHTTGKLIVKHAISSDEPLRERAVDNQQQDACECKRNDPVSFSLLFRVQESSGPCIDGKIIGKVNVLNEIGLALFM